MRDLLKSSEPERVKRVCELRPHTLHPAEIVTGRFLSGEFAMNAGAEQLPGHVAGRGSGLAGQAAPLRFVAVSHMRTERSALGQAHSLTRPQQNEGDNERRDND